MHAAWQIYEIRQMILSYLRPGDLARLGQTCRELSKCSIDHLWAELNTLEGFARLLPSDPRETPLRLEDLERLDFYGRKVQRLYLTTEEGKRKIEVPQLWHTKGERRKTHRKYRAAIESWTKLWGEISQLRPQTAFLPNLQHLRINNIAAELLLPLIGISGKRLESIYIKAVHEPKDVLRRVLESFMETPKLGYLFVRNGLPNHVPESLINNSPLTTLRLDPTMKLRYGNQDWQLNNCVLMKSSVENLTVGLPQCWYSPNYKAADAKYLPLLKQLRLNLRNFSSVKCSQHCQSCILPWTGNPERAQKTANLSHPYPDWIHDCKRKPPSFFIRSLDRPHLTLLNLKFNEGVDGALLLDTMKAVVDTCHLGDLSELVLSSGGHISRCSCHPGRGEPAMDRSSVWKMLKMLGPLPHLRVLRLPLACNFFEEFNIEEYANIAKAFPALQKLSIGHKSFNSRTQYSYHVYDRTPLRHVAAFCHLFPDLDDVEIGCIDITCLDEELNPRWSSPNVRKFHLGDWVSAADLPSSTADYMFEQQMSGLQTYFPNASSNMKEILMP